MATTTTSVVIEKVNNKKVNVIGKTFDSASYSGDVGSRNKIVGQTFITTDDVEDNMTVRGEGHDTLIRKVEAVEKAEVFVQLLNAEGLPEGKSLASAILKGVWKARGIENDLEEIFVMAGTANDRALCEIIDIARSMAQTEMGRRAMGKWYPMVDGRRVIIRLINTIDKKGRITEHPGCCDCDECSDDDTF